MVMAMATTTAALARTIHILPIGDSITQGGKTDREEYTYRWPLFCMLTDAGVGFGFVGSLTQGLQPGAKWPAEYKGKPFDPHHEGHYGWKTAKVWEKLPEWSQKWSAAPDIVLIHLGTNDQGKVPTKENPWTAEQEQQEQERIQKQIVEPLESVIAFLREKNPNVAVLVGHLNFNDGSALKIRPLVEAMAKRLNSEQSPVITVHHYQGWKENPAVADSDTFDWAHPNPSGQQKMAQKWFEAMQPVLQTLK